MGCLSKSLLQSAGVDVSNLIAWRGWTGELVANFATMKNKAFSGPGSAVVSKSALADRTMMNVPAGQQVKAGA